MVVIGNAFLQTAQISNNTIFLDACVSEKIYPSPHNS